jgi:AbrB family looped-hinge helix DNA binding protein
MSESTISSKGQVTIPKAIRDRMRLKAGDRLRFVVDADGSVRLASAGRDVSTLRFDRKVSKLPEFRLLSA